ncbi:MAG TPA: hypothetical protein VGO84_18445, partial [Burkholderiales bacterium]|nr:hypothetical protein [Burkholderiales bacterium]
MFLRDLFGQIRTETAFFIGNVASDWLGLHGLRNQALGNSRGRRYEEQLRLEDARKEYIRNIRADCTDLNGWHDLLRVLSTLAVGGAGSELDVYLVKLRQQDETLFRRAVTATLDDLERARPEDFYLLATRAHAALPNDLSLWWYWLCAMSFVEREQPQDVARQTMAWARQLVSAQPDTFVVPNVAPAAGRKIRIGYIGSKLHFMFLCNHINHHDFNRFEILLFTDDARCAPGQFHSRVSVQPLGTGD